LNTELKDLVNDKRPITGKEVFYIWIEMDTS
jgi:hypothetical protein